MSRASYPLKRRGMAFGVAIVSCLLGLAPGSRTEATTVCDTDPAAVPFQPTVDPTLLNALIDTLGAIDVNQTSNQSAGLLFNHTLFVTLNSSIDLGGTDFIVTPGFGFLEVELAIPEWSTNLSTSMSHAACRNCGSEYSSCLSGCDTSYSNCVNGCDAASTRFPCFGNRTCCTVECSPALGLCDAGCLTTRGVCEVDPVRLACIGEREAIDFLLSGHNFGMRFASASVTQTADICVTGDCNVPNPVKSTVADLNGFGFQFFPTGDPLGVGSWLNGMITGLIDWALNIEGTIASFFETPEGQGVLILPFALDIASDGCLPVQEVIDCAGGGCSTVNRPSAAIGRSANLLFYGLPVALLAGILLWRRKR